MVDPALNRVLVVEDDPAWRDILAEILTDIGLAVKTVDSLEASLSELQTASHRLAVVDLSLGGVDHHNQDGLLVLDAIRLHNPGCVALLLTGYANVELAVSAISTHGAFTCLRKETFDRREFREILRQALASTPPGGAMEGGAPGLSQERSTQPAGTHLSGKTETGLLNRDGQVQSLSAASRSPDHPRSQVAGAHASGLALVVEDSVPWRTVLSELLVEAGFQVHPCASYGEALGRLGRGKYTLAVIDLSLAGPIPSPAVLFDTPSDGQRMEGFRLLASARAGGVPTIVVSGLDDPDEIERAYTEHAIFAYLPKQVFSRKGFLDTVEELLKESGTEITGLRIPDSLTSREREVLDLLAKGLTNKEIAEALVISNNTVKRHLKAIFEKLNVHTRSAATARVVGGTSAER